MQFLAREAGREERVRVRRTGEHLYEVTVGGRPPFLVDARPTGGARRSLIVDGRQVEVAVKRHGDGRYAVSGGGALRFVEVEDPLTHLARRGRRQDQHVEERVTAYMPGRVVAVLVAEGEAVAAGQGIVVLEAMKMQNEIQAERAGTIKALFVRPGEAVETGNPLFELE
jgi:pyruvate carboxylase subunit B